jgi:hypothetical protein
MTDEIILYDSDQSAVYEERKVKGWWSVKSQTHHGVSVFWKDDEHMARWDGCTHKMCDECGKNIHEKHYTCCHKCRDRHEKERYEKLPIAEWDEKTPVCTFDGDQYFFSPDQILDHLCEYDCQSESLMLVICEPIYPSQISTDYWCDELHDDGELPGDILDALDALNNVIARSKPIAWGPGKKRFTFKTNCNEQRFVYGGILR